MTPQKTGAASLALAATFLTLASPVSAGEALEPGTASLSLRIEGRRVEAELLAPSATLVGFERAPQGSEERSTLQLATQNLKSGDALVRFGPEAGCRLVGSRVDASPAPAKGERQGHLGASWRFECERPEHADRVALGLFMGFPALQRVRVRYLVPAGRGEATATQGSPALALVPMGH